MVTLVVAGIALSILGTVLSLGFGLAAFLLFKVAPILLVGSSGDLQQMKPDAFKKLHDLIKRQPGESRWMEVVWHPSIWEARKKAAAEGKPLFLWAGSGGAPPAGC